MTAGRNNAEVLSQHWCTPPKYVNAIREFFAESVTLDPCSNRHSIVEATVEYSLPEIDGLSASWNYPTIFVNPPYGRDRDRGTTIRDWLRKCTEAHLQHGVEVLALVPVATNTRHWKQYVFGAATAVAFLYDTRLRFLVNGRDGGKGAPMSCAMVYWGPQYERFEKIFVRFGA
ncbi:MAG: N-6 DNA methylase, partial [Gemmatimonadetes bacterium]|nr:N-6 DNA methylase [Gemmatimonadota bacterium]